ncbi:MAG: hypothetical protein QXL51_03980 [Candidatus Aenigmatarchaeota archaeon]
MSQYAQVVKTYKNDFLNLINEIEKNEKELQNIINAKLTQYKSTNDDIQNAIKTQLSTIQGETEEVLYAINNFKKGEDTNYIYNFYINTSATYRAYLIYRALSNDEDKALMDAVYTKIQLLTNFSKLFLQYFIKVKNITINDAYNKIRNKLSRAISKATKLLDEVTILLNKLNSSKDINNNLNLTYTNLLYKAQDVLKQKIEQFNKNEIKDIIEYLFEFNKYLNLINIITYNIVEIGEKKFTGDIVESAKQANDFSFSASRELLDIVLLLTL